MYQQRSYKIIHYTTDDDAKAITTTGTTIYYRTEGAWCPDTAWLDRAAVDFLFLHRKTLFFYTLELIDSNSCIKNCIEVWFFYILILLDKTRGMGKETGEHEDSAGMFLQVTWHHSSLFFIHNNS